MGDRLQRLRAALAPRYQIEGELGQGGMSTVYLAADNKHHRQVAIKVLRETLAASVGSERFLREIEIAARLTHPHILPVYDSGEVEGNLYYVMPYVEGSSLRQHLHGSRPLPLHEALQIGREVASALDYAHRHDVVHRDIKPENILLSGGHALVADFGIARALCAAGDSTLTSAGALVGTPAYMSPEQVSACSPVDGRSDIYSLGCVLYEMLTGALPFPRGSVQEVMARRLVDAAPRLDQFDLRVPDHIRQTVKRTLARKPEQRFATAAELEQALVSEASAAPASGPRGWRLPRKSSGLAVSALLVAVVLLLLPTVFPSARRWLPWRGPAGTHAAINSIAVLPLDNLSGDPSQDYFADGMTEELIAQLAHIAALRVISRSSVMRYKGARKPLQEIASELRVESVVEGSVLREGQHVRIVAKLIDAVSDRHLWAQTYDRQVQDVLALQSEVARGIADEIEVRLSASEKARLHRVRQVNPEAYECYLKGRFQWNKRTPEALQMAIDYFRQAIAIDPTDGLSYAGLADSYGFLWIYGLLPPAEALARSVEAARHAIQLDESLAEAHASLATDLDLQWNWEGARKEFERALELNPGYATAHQWYAELLAKTGEIGAALQHIDRARELDPLSPAINGAAGTLRYFARRYDEALGILHNAVAMDPQLWLTRFYLGLTYFALSLPTEGIAELQKTVELSGGNPLSKAALGYAYATCGRRNQAEQILAELKKLEREGRAMPSHLVLVHIGLGQHEDAIECTLKAYEQHDVLLSFVKVQPMLDPLREDPRFEQILQRMGLPPDAAPAARGAGGGTSAP